MFLKNWKLLAVLGVFIWSLTTLFQVVTQEEFKRYEQMANMSPEKLQESIDQRLRSIPNWEKMNSFQREDLQKQYLEEASFANNIQVIGHYDKYVILTNLKLGL